MRRGYRDDPLTGDFEGERVFSGPAELRYVLRELEGSELLLVLFSAVHPPDDEPRYYMHRTFSEIPCHRLFVLDDHGPDDPLRRPSWYLGRARAADVPDAVCELVTVVAEELGVARRRVVTCGGSKGAWAALYFAARCGAGLALAGEPQVFLGRYLHQEEHLGVARHVAGEGDDARRYLDGLVFDAFRAAPEPPAVSLYCGRGSPYLEREVMPLARFLEGLGVSVDVDLGDHSDHVPDLGRHFPGYVKGRLADLLQPR